MPENRGNQYVSAILNDKLIKDCNLVKPVTDNFIVTFFFNYARDLYEISPQKIMANFPGNIINSVRPIKNGPHPRH
jgi:hypothetical protein